MVTFLTNKNFSKLSRSISGDDFNAELLLVQNPMERSSNLSMKASTGRATEECDMRESSSAAI